MLNSRPLDVEVDAAIAEGRRLAGFPNRRVGNQELAENRPVTLLPRKTLHNPRWTANEDAFLKENLLHLSYAEIGARLGRSETAVMLRRKRLFLPAPSQQPEFLTANRAARMLGIDPHCIMRLLRLNILEGLRLPGKKGIIMIKRSSLLRWAVQPKNWIYFDNGRVRDDHLKRLLELQEQRWEDQWLSVGQVAAMEQVSGTMVNERIRQGRLKAVRWGNWHVLRSEVERTDLEIHAGKGRPGRSKLTPSAWEFLVLATAIGLPKTSIAGLLKMRPKSVSYYSGRIWEDESIITLAHSTKVQVDMDRRLLFADWRACASRFPRLAQAARSLVAGDAVGQEMMKPLRFVLAHWVHWHTSDKAGEQLARSLNANRQTASLHRLQEQYSQVKGMNIDPFALLG